jgi:hypothetical protein
VIVAVMTLFSLLGTTMGWADETLGFYALLIPLLLALGYDRMAVAGMIIGSATVGAMASTVNPFSIGVASGFAGVGIGDGIGLRWIGLVRAHGDHDRVRRPLRGAGERRPRPLARRLPPRGRRAGEEGRVGLASRAHRAAEGGPRDHCVHVRAARVLVVPWDSIFDLGVKVDPYTHEPLPNDPGGTSAGGSPS